MAEFSSPEQSRTIKFPNLEKGIIESILKNYKTPDGKDYIAEKLKGIECSLVVGTFNKEGVFQDESVVIKHYGNQNLNESQQLELFKLIEAGSKYKTTNKENLEKYGAATDLIERTAFSLGKRSILAFVVPNQYLFENQKIENNLKDIAGNVLAGCDTGLAMIDQQAS